MTLADAFIVLLITGFVVAYRLRDKTKDQEREQAFTDSITGTGPWSKK